MQEQRLNKFPILNEGQQFLPDFSRDRFNT